MNNRSVLPALIASLAMFLCHAGFARTEPRDLRATFQTTTQALFDAITSGDKTLWDRTMDPDCVITTEDGEVQGKKKFLEELVPLPQGFVGRGTIRGLTVRDLGGAAVVHYFIDETEDIFEQQLRTTYVETDTYQQQSGGWKMVAMQVTVVPRDLEPVAGDRSGWPALLGAYHFPGDDKVRYRVFMNGSRLMGGRDEKSAKELIPLAPLVFYQQGSIHIYVFVQPAGKAITELRELHKYNEVRMLHTGVDGP
jgi:Domain of unknown function (DUF4440)